MVIVVWIDEKSPTGEDADELEEAMKEKDTEHDSLQGLVGIDLPWEENGDERHHGIVEELDDSEAGIDILFAVEKVSGEFDDKQHYQV